VCERVSFYQKKAFLFAFFLCLPAFLFEEKLQSTVQQAVVKKEKTSRKSEEDHRDKAGMSFFLFFLYLNITLGSNSLIFFVVVVVDDI